MVKRRKTLSAEAFYGSGGDPISARVSDGWRAFYEKLQFRVSHSLMCQLEGTAAISSSFPRQQEAFEFADQVTTLRLRLQSTCEPAQKLGCDTDLVPRVFSFESVGDGKRRFLVTSFSEFWKNYRKTRADQRHVYEIIREDTPADEAVSSPPLQAVLNCGRTLSEFYKRRIKFQESHFLIGVATAHLLAGNGEADIDAIQLAEAFESGPTENSTQLLDESVSPAVLESAMISPAEETVPRELKPAETSSTASLETNSHAKGAPIGLPYGGALVAVEATALLVSGATIVVLVVAKLKTRAALDQFEEEDEINPMLQSLLYSDMDYAAI
ncbi:hypothetical protein BBJ29_004409 [Phytophthora kernoviae]|uniref:DNA-directed primase/polymerase protein n=1 Tax=Phytophthora kernoviae TaxID=325452 RepID=A0A3F2S003_9STRA|nr:hypothetical protein BBJ29_004409 [Phytophthora kernoviae]RLN67070.1 hypothetical protein BBP00_00001860 [Phytophthora kernoviae]